MAPHAEAPQKPEGRIETTLLFECFGNVAAKEIQWVWRDRIPKGKLVVFAGNPDTGKTTAAIDIIGRVTTGRQFGDQSEAFGPTDVLMLIAEDDPADTIKPRLLAAEADVNRVSFLKAVEIRQGAKKHDRMLALDRDLTLLEDHLIRNPNIGLVVLDPMSSYLGQADMNREQKLREVLIPIKEMAERTGVTVIGLAHFNKRVDVGALHKVGGAVAMSGVSRATWLFAKNPEADGEYLMLLGKGNLTKKRTGLRYRFGEAELATGTAPFIIWGGDTEGDADSVFATANDPNEKREAKAARFLEDFLANGPKQSEEIITEGKKSRISRVALFKAKKELGVRAQKIGYHWEWSLPDGD